MSHEFDRMRIEQLIRQAKQNRAEHLTEFWAPAVKKAVVGLLVLIATVVPWLKGGSDS